MSTETTCESCYACIGARPAREGSWLTVGMTIMIVCPKCGNKRCPHSTDHRHACTGSNEQGQPGSRYALPSSGPIPSAAEFLASLNQEDE